MEEKGREGGSEEGGGREGGREGVGSTRLAKHHFCCCFVAAVNDAMLVAIRRRPCD